MHLLKKLLKNSEDRFLLATLILFSLFRLPSFFEPNWYGDEGIYQVLGRAIRAGRILYSGIWDNKPPLLYLTYALVNADEFWIRFLSYLAGLFAVVMLYILAKKLFLSRKAAYVSTAVFAFLFAIPTTEANIANAENFMLVFIVTGGYLIYKATTSEARKKTPQLFLAGLLLATAFLYKIVALFDFAAFFLFLSFTSLPEKIVSIRKDIKILKFSLLPLTLGFLGPIVFTGIIFLLLGAFLPFLQATFSNNVSYVGYKNYFLIPQGLLITKLILLSGFTFLLFRARIRMPKTTLFLLLWFAFSLFDAFFSQRPYTHYFLMTITSLSLLSGLLLDCKTYKKIIALCLIIGIGMTFWVFKPIRIPKLFSYYTHFTEYVLGRETTETYQASFDSDVPNDYMIAQFLKNQMKGSANRTLFLWGNTAQIYTLSDTLPPGKYTVAYHIASSKALEETQNAINKKRPRFIALLKDSDVPQLLLTAYSYKATIGNAIIYERTF